MLRGETTISLKASVALAHQCRLPCLPVQPIFPKLIAAMEHISLDGVIQASGEDDFPYADWTVPYRTPADRDALLAGHGGASCSI